MKKKIIPVIMALFLILVLAVIGVILKQVEKYTPTKERADLKEYFSIESEEDVAVIFQNELSEVKGLLRDGQVYIDYETVITYLNERFYWDKHENMVVFATPEEIICTDIGTDNFYTYELENRESAGYIISISEGEGEGEQLYLASEYIKKYTNVEFEIFQEPNHMRIKNDWTTPVLYADITKDNFVRYQGGIKSPVLTDVKAGDTVTVLEELETWTKVITADAYIGYIQNKFLTEQRTEHPVSNFEEPVYTNISKDYKINLVWHQVTTEAANAQMEAAMSGVTGVNTISPTWFSLSDNDGNISSIASLEYVNQAHQMGLEVWGLVDNFSKEVSTLEVLSYTSKRARLIQNLISKAIEFNLDGINIDFEEVSAETGESYIQFIRELSIACREKGLVLSIDNYVPMAHTAHYNRKEQGVVADYVIIMGYDEHYRGSKEAGSVASIGFVKEGIERTVAEVPSEKVINAVPFYTRVWKEIPKTEEELAEESATEEFVPYKLESDAVGMEKAETLLEENGITPVWDEETKQHYAEFEREGVNLKVWMENEASIAEKMKLVQEYELGGSAAWKLGFQKNSIWEVISSYLK